MIQSEIRDTVAFYRSRMTSHMIPKVGVTESSTSVTRNAALAHVHQMLDEVEEFVVNGQIDKAQHWFGFVQGVFWGANIFTLEEIKSHNHSS